MHRRSRSNNLRERGGQWHYRFQVAGIEYSASTGLDATAANLRKAARIAADAKVQAFEQADEDAIDDERKPFDLAAGEFIAWARVRHRNKENTWRRLETSLVSAVRFFGRTLTGLIHPKEIEEYKTFRIVENGVRDVTLRHDLHALSRFFQFAITMNWAHENPIEKVDIPSDADSRREHVLTIEEERSYFAVAKGPLKDVATLILNQGCRPDEIMSLRRGAFDARQRTLAIEGGKSRSARRTLILTAESMEVLTRQTARAPDSPWMFASDRIPGRHITKLNATHDRACLNAGVSFVLYDLRHTFATRAVEAGVDLPTLAKILGHGDLRTLMRYVHPTTEAQRAAMARYEAAANRRKLTGNTGP